MFKINYSWWFFILCILAAFSLAFLLYARSSFRKNNKFFSFPNIILFLLRFIFFSFLCFFLLSPFIKKTTERIEKPILLFGFDNSKSILLNKDSVYYKTVFLNEINSLPDKILKKYKVLFYTFGAKVNYTNKIDFTDSRTNISGFLDYAYEQYFNSNLGALIIASDGIYNEGKNPLGSLSGFHIPIYTIAMGDTTLQRDVFIGGIEYNSIAYLGNKFPIRVKVSAHRCSGNKVQLQLIHNDKIVQNEEIFINTTDFDKEIDLQGDADKIGIQKYTINITGVKDEISYRNNRKEIYIDVLESRKRILILANSPHPDVFAIKNCFLKNDNYTVNSMLFSDFPKGSKEIEKELEKYDLLIIHQLPSKIYPARELFQVLDSKRIPLFIILGNQSSIPLFSSYDLGLNIIQRRDQNNSVLPAVSTTFNYFNLPDKLFDLVNELPPLSVPFGDFKPQSDYQSALTQKIGKVNTEYPLLMFVTHADRRIAILTGEGIWKWPLAEYKIFQNQDIFDALITKSLQYISLGADKRYFRLKDPKNTYFEDEQIYFDAEVFNPSYEKQKNAKINIWITDKKGKSSEYNFQETDEGYHATIGYFPVGVYRYKASTIAGGKLAELYGEFSVSPVDIEYVNTIADHNLLYTIAKEKDGKMFYPNELDKLIETLNNNPDIKPMSYFDKQITDLIDIKWFFFILLLFISTEWFLRKFYGGY